MNPKLSINAALSICKLAFHYADQHECGERLVHGICPLESPRAGCISFSSSKNLLDTIAPIDASGLGALIVPRGAKLPEQPTRTPILISDHPLRSIVQLVPHLHQYPQPQQSIHPLAIISPTAQLGQGVTIGAYSIVGEMVRIGDNSIILSQVIIEDGVSIGHSCTIHAGSVIRSGGSIGNYCVISNDAVIGNRLLSNINKDHQPHNSDPNQDTLLKDHIDLGDYVDLGARATLSFREEQGIKVASGTKLDNTVNIVGPTTIGHHSVLCGQVNLAGNNRVGNQVILGGAVSVDKNLSIADGVRVGGSATVAQDLTTRGDYSGNPTIPKRQWVRRMGLLGKLA